MVIKDKKGLHIRKAIGMLVTPYIYDNKLDDYVLGDNTYDIIKIVANSMEITQEDSDTKEICNEFSKEPILENTINGKFTFSVECIDFGNTIMKAIYGYSVGRDDKHNEIDGAIAFVDQKKPIYCAIHIKFSDTPDIFLPKVKLDNNININNLKGKGSSVLIKGYLKPYKTIVYLKNNAMNFYMNNEYIYNPYAPIYFVPKGYDVAVFKQDGNNSDEEIYTTEIDAKDKKISLINGFVA